MAEEIDFEEHHLDEFKCTDCDFIAISKSEIVDHNLMHSSINNVNSSDNTITESANEILPQVDLNISMDNDSISDTGITENTNENLIYSGVNLLVSMENGNNSDTEITENTNENHPDIDMHISTDNGSITDTVISENTNDNQFGINFQDNHSISESNSYIESVSINESDYSENSISIVKREHKTQEENSSKEDYQDKKIGIKRIKLEPEDIDIDQDVEDVDSHHSLCEIDDYGQYGDIKQDSKDFSLGVIPKNENWEFSDQRQTVSEFKSEHTNMFNEGFTFAQKGLLKAKKDQAKHEFAKRFDYLFEFKAIYRGLKSIDVIFCKICNFSSRKISDLYNHAGEHIQKLGRTLIPRSSLPVNYDYFVCTICHNRIMRKADIQIHMKNHRNVPFSSAIVDVKFIQNFDDKEKADVLLHCCEICNLAFIRYISIVKHLNDHTPEEIAAADVFNDYNYLNSEDHGHFLEALDNNKDMPDSTCHIGGPMRRGTPKLEIEIDNTGKYIPDGWQRKVYQITKGTQKGSYKVWFISPFGYFLYNKLKVYQHIESLESKGITQCVNVELMDFSAESHNLPIENKRKKKRGGKASRGSEEVEVDNTDIYVPEGWQRKVYMITTGPNRGKHFILYISPFNTNVYSRSSANKYIETLQKKGIHISIDVNRLDYSIPPHLAKDRPVRITKVEVEIDNAGKYIPDGWQRKMFRITQGADKGIHKIAYISPLGNLTYCRTVVEKHIEKLESNGFTSPVNVQEMDFVLPTSYYSYNKKKGSKKKKGRSPRQREEFDIDNKDIYIPEGWKRKLFRYINGPSKGQYFICYESPFKKEIQGKTKIEEYLKSLAKQDCHLSVDIERLNFSIPSELCKTKPADHNKVEVEIDNTGIYIPEGWQRKVIQMTHGPETGSYKVHYVTPNGKVLYHRGHVLEYVQKLAEDGISLPINVEEMDFKPSSNKLYNIKVKKSWKNPSLTPREEIKVDNTEMYIPEGWQRKTFRYTAGPSKGKYFIKYISPYEKEIFSKKNMIEYLNSLEISGCSLSVDIQRLNYSVAPHQLKLLPVDDTKKLDV